MFNKSINSTDWLIIMWYPNGNLLQQSLAWSHECLDKSWKAHGKVLEMHWSETVDSDLLFKTCLGLGNSGSMCGFHKGTNWPWRVEIFPTAMLCWGFLQWKKSFQIMSYIMTQFCRIVVIRVTISTIELIWTMEVLIWTGIWGFQLKPLCPKWADEIWTQSERECVCVCACACACIHSMVSSPNKESPQPLW